MSINSKSSTMQLFSYKTNITNQSALTRVAPVLNNLVGSRYWHLDADHRDKVLTVFSHDIINEKQLLKSLRRLGFKLSDLKECAH